MSHPYPPFGTQDLHDDDAQVIDSLSKEVDAPADIHGAVEPVTPAPTAKPLNPTRLQASTVLLSGGAPATPLLGEDLQRNTCNIRVYSSAPTPVFNDLVLIKDELGHLSAGMAGINITVHHNQTVNLDGHTGKLYAIPGSGITASIEVTAWGVTHYDTPYSPE